MNSESVANSFRFLKITACFKLSEKNWLHSVQTSIWANDSSVCGINQRLPQSEVKLSLTVSQQHILQIMTALLAKSFHLWSLYSVLIPFCLPVNWPYQ